MYFGTSGQEHLIPNPLGTRGGDMLTRHIERLERLAQEQPTPLREQLPTLVIEQKGTVFNVQGNAAASELLNTQFPCALSGLNLTRDGLSNLSEHLRQTDGQSGFHEVTIHAKVGIFHGRLYSLNSGAQMLTLAAISWSDARLSPMADRFDLTTSETQVLAGL